MTVDQIRRAAVAAGTAAAVIGLPADLYHFTIDSRTAAATTTAFRFHGVALVLAFVLLLVALAGLVLAQDGRSGRLGTLGAGIALLGTALVIGDLAKEAFGMPLAPEQLGDPTGWYLVVVVVSFGLLALGWLLTALALRRAGVISGPATWLLGAGAVLTFPPIPGAYVVLLIAVAVATRSLLRPAVAQQPAVPARVAS